ncbi:hypothetical protein SLEP1_g37430 [Rubroshorea leprosula]|uniref:Uncharacterized protein n=1 Tax=Rubroshorea leprosula TaxID=152421 RepID=A0AAV5KUL4_9ROSI|nr:hypothetical protein SLEP1_g37430 [Rubroshorea leprosula]
MTVFCWVPMSKLDLSTLYQIFNLWPCHGKCTKKKEGRKEGRKHQACACASTNGIRGEGPYIYRGGSKFSGSAIQISNQARNVNFKGKRGTRSILVRFVLNREELKSGC